MSKCERCNGRAHGTLCERCETETGLNERITELEARTPDKAQQLIIEDLAMLVRRFCAGRNIADKAMDYLVRKGLQGSILRDDKENN